MGKKILIHLLLIAIPFLVWFAYAWLRQRAEARGQVWRDAPFVALLAIGLAISTGALFFLDAFEGAPPGSTYLPAHVDEQGEIVPGRFE